MLFIDDDQAELGEGQEQGRAGADDNPCAAVGHRLPGLAALGLADVGMPLCGEDAEPVAKAFEPLCTEGYLERRENPDDRRAYRVYLTDSARPVLLGLSKIATQFEEELFAGFAEQDLARLDELLGLMARNLGDPGDRSDSDKFWSEPGGRASRRRWSVRSGRPRARSECVA